VQPWLRRRQRARQDRPPVSIVIPVRRLENDADAALASAFRQVYPRVEVLVSAQQQASPMLDLAARVAARHPDTPSRVLRGNPQFTPNPKVSNLAPAIAAARYDLILVKDANVRLESDQLGEFVGRLTPGIGMVCAVPIGVAPLGFAAEIECAVLNGHAAPLMFGASLLRITVGFGKIMLFERGNFYRAGGIAAIADTFGDDQALAKALARIGLRTVFAGGVIRQTLGRRSLREVCDRQLRWLVIRRCEEPLVLLSEPLFYWGFTAAAGAAGAQLLDLPAGLAAAATIALLLALETAVVALKGWGWSWQFPLAGLCREILMPALWVESWFLRSVTWGGTSFPVPGRSR